MSYELRLSNDAIETLRSLDLASLDEVERNLRLLAESPSTLSYRSTFPWPPDRQIYEFNVDLGLDTWYRFSVHFRSGQDEQTLQILTIGRVAYLREPDDGWPEA